MNPKITRSIAAGPLSIGGQNPLALIAGPCVIESEKIAMEIAEKLKRITTDLHVPFIFKASYDKANRTSIKSFRGPGLNDGLKILQKIKTELDLQFCLTFIKKKKLIRRQKSSTSCRFPRSFVVKPTCWSRPRKQVNPSTLKKASSSHRGI